jgi:hypothetical protein
MTHIDNKEFLHSVLTIFGNLLTQDKTFFIINNMPIILRLKNLLNDHFNSPLVRNNILWILNIIFAKMNKDELIIFLDFNKILMKIFKISYTKVDLERILPLFNLMSRDDEYILDLMHRDFTNGIFDIMRKNSDPSILNYCVKILTNILAEEDDSKIVDLMDEGDIVLVDNIFQNFNKSYLIGNMINTNETNLYERSLISNSIKLVNNIIMGPIRNVNIIYDLGIHNTIFLYCNIELNEVLFFILNTMFVGDCNCILQLINTDQLFKIIKMGIFSKSDDILVTLDILIKLVLFIDVEKFYSCDVSGLVMRDIDDEIYHRLTYLSSVDNIDIVNKSNMILENLAC